MQRNGFIRSLICKLAVAAAVIGVLATATVAGEAKAVSSTQSVDGIVNVVYADLDQFWAGLWPATRHPGVGYYNWVNSSGGTVEYPKTGCGSTADNHGTQGFYCPSSYNGEIYFDFTQQRNNLIGIGDGAVALWTAHEYGHHAERMLGIDWTSAAPYHEQLADCFAGLYFRWGVYHSKRLVLADVNEARVMFSRLGTDRDHGTPQQRLRAFDYGFNSIGYKACVNGWKNW